MPLGAQASTYGENLGTAKNNYGAALPSRRLRRLTTTRFRLLLRLRPERTQHITGAVPTLHRRRVVAKPVPHHPVEQLHLVGDLPVERFELVMRATCPRLLPGPT